ncbi:MAG: exosortase/archaeosortase family protein [Armatimonadetes bacterium]|nr:exosortase/archaeosortase family protein [Armatimonadota bacterium]
MDDIRDWLQARIDYLKGLDWNVIVRSANFWLAIGAIGGLFLMFWSLFRGTVQNWINNDYYSHGWIVPLLIAWQIKVRQEDWNKTPVTNGVWALAAFVPILLIQYIGFVGDFWAIQCLMFVSFVMTSIWLLFGFKRAKLLAMPICFALFALPIWGSFIDAYTNPLQMLSTDVAEMLLKLFGFHPLRLEGQTLQLNSYALTVAVPCSGLKLMVAVSCFTAHFTLIARKEWSFNVLMFMLVVPLCLFINGLRIALIGVVGELQGADAAHQFHDWSGYITLLICFMILFKFARWFGWKG